MSKNFKVKFFGAKHRKEQVVLKKMTIEAEKASEVENILREQYNYIVINGLKIH